jgi:outer membrane protein OmpA-like peptidoglycan-associated protein
MTAREAVQTAEDARVISLRRQEEERIATERRLAAERQAKAEADAAEAVKQRQAAEAAKADAERAKLEAQLEAERAARQKMEAEQARQAALADAERQRIASQAEMDRQRAAAQAELDRQRQAAQVEVDRAKAAAEEADRLRRQAEADKAEIRSRLMNQLNSILQTRDSVRGLIVNMSDVLFDTGSYTLRPAAREKLAKMSGILLAYPGLTLQVEGHTDSVGGDEYNQTLSEHRAGSVRDYLVQEGVGSAAVTSRGFGKTRPVDTNETAGGRQANRRVEIVVTGDMIGAAKASADASPAQ